jgi:hypothetical protein
MLYVASLGRNRLLKVGVTGWNRLVPRRAELRQKLNAPRLDYLIIAHVPWGWGSDTEWERRLLTALRKNGGRLQLFSDAELSEEVVDATATDVSHELKILRRPTEVPLNARALDLAADKEDWRFLRFMEFAYPEARYSRNGYFPTHWADPLNRLAFLYWLRGEPIMRSIRLREGLCCDEIEEVLTARRKPDRSRGAGPQRQGGTQENAGSCSSCASRSAE